MSIDVRTSRYSFLDQRTETGFKRTKENRFVRDGPDTFGASDTPGLASTDALPLQQVRSAEHDYGILRSAVQSNASGKMVYRQINMQ